MNTYLIANGSCGERLASVMTMLYQCGFYGSDNPVKGVLVIDNDTENRAKVHLKEIVDAVNGMNAAMGSNVPAIEFTHWAPKVGDAQSVNNIITNTPEMEALSLIMTSDELAQTIEGKGYAGHVNIGMTLVNTTLETDSHGKSSKAEFEEFMSKACQKQGGERARFIIIGSTHGGTGASLNTAIATKLRSYYKGSSAKIEVIGLFMMSYYSIPPMKNVKANVAENTNEKDNNDRLHINPHQFRPADIDALEGYRSMKLIDGKNPVFDNILLCGYEPRIPTNLHHQEGGNDQDNRYSVPELLMCAGARYFFEGSTVSNKYLGIDLGNFDGMLRWRNMPYSQELQRCLGSMGLLACSVSEYNNEAVWNKQLTEKNGIKYMDPKNKEKEYQDFEKSNEALYNFAVIFWNILYQISTTVNETWNDKIVLLKRAAFENCSSISGFGWVNDITTDATIIDMDARTFTGVNTPCVSTLVEYFRQNLKKNKENKTLDKNSNVDDRVKAYFKALFDASYKTYGEGNK